MAGKGAAPGAHPSRKDPAQRRRVNAEPGFIELPAEGYLGPVPPLPASYTFGGRSRRYLSATRDWYKTWGRSPMAVLFASTDWQRLAMLAPLVDGHFREPSVKVMTELRLHENALGATVMDRQRLRLRICETRPDPESGRETVTDLRRRMRAI
jgi:hypothetical protein